jgi:hypothetical protein
MGETTVRIQAALVEAVEGQVNSGIPAEPKATLSRLMGGGFTRNRALGLMALAYQQALDQTIQDGKPFSEAAYAEALRALPGIKRR